MSHGTPRLNTEARLKPVKSASRSHDGNPFIVTLSPHTKQARGDSSLVTMYQDHVRRDQPQERPWCCAD